MWLTALTACAALFSQRRREQVKRLVTLVRRRFADETPSTKYARDGPFLRHAPQPPMLHRRAARCSAVQRWLVGSPLCACPCHGPDPHRTHGGATTGTGHAPKTEAGGRALLLSCLCRPMAGPPCFGVARVMPAAASGGLRGHAGTSTPWSSCTASSAAPRCGSRRARARCRPSPTAALRSHALRRVARGA